MKKIHGLAKAFGKVIAATRTAKGISQEQLAESIDATNVYICLLETGQRQPSLNATLLIAEQLGVKPEYLIKEVYSLLQKEDV
ncbi:MAG: helix-turn-helix transcriptional regulator [Mailhella sp.]|nr:helix-turn-helix transcriptional regulator [Mailhella sp.]MBQ4615895.1 helix-turn-helix transcriptional regulator [Mailhella sp.]